MDTRGQIYELPEDAVAAATDEHREAAARLDGFLRGRSEAELLKKAEQIHGAGANRDLSKFGGKDDQRS